MLFTLIILTRHFSRSHAVHRARVSEIFEKIPRSSRKELEDVLPPEVQVSLLGAFPAARTSSFCAALVSVFLCTTLLTSVQVSWSVS